MADRLQINMIPGNIYDIRRSLRLYKILCGIQFHSLSTSLPDHLNYSLIFASNLESEDLDNPFEDLHWKTRENTLAFNDKEISEHDKNIYYKEGFLQIQNAIYLSFMQLLYSQNIKFRGHRQFYDFHVNLKQMPLPASSANIDRKGKYDEWAETIFFLSYLFPTFFLTHVSFVYRILEKKIIFLLVFSSRI